MKYVVDGYGGYVAEVTYDGQAVYPDARPAVYAPTGPIAIAAPAYRPQPTPAPYRPQPTPVPYRPQPTPAPVIYRPQPIQPYAAASGQTASYSLPPPATSAPSVRRYTFRTATESAPVQLEREGLISFDKILTFREI